MHDHRLNEAEADGGLKLSNRPTEPLTGGGHEIPQHPELQSPPISTSTPPPLASRSPGRTVRELAHKLSQQNLKLTDQGSTQTQPQHLEASELSSSNLTTTQASPPFPVISQDLSNLPDCTSSREWPILEVDDEPEASEDTATQDPPYLSLLAVARRRSQYFRGEGSLRGGGEPPSGSLSPGARLRKQLSTQFRDKPTTSVANTARIEQMISSGTQCNVQNMPLPTASTSTSATTAAPPKSEPVKRDYVYSPMELEVDEAYCNGNDTFEEDLSFVDSIMSLRRAGAPGGIRKQVVNGVPLRYQLSADAALRCQTVVKNRPRMRRRKKTRPESMASSAATSAISSPVIPPSIPSPHHNPWE
ncbi:hypothetical protein V8F20_000522 [Naviculisporaceae sp. PSN 640]